MLGSLFLLIYFAAGVLILYGIIRMAVKHGIEDARRDNPFG